MGPLYTDLLVVGLGNALRAADGCTKTLYSYYSDDNDADRDMSRLYSTFQCAAGLRM